MVFAAQHYRKTDIAEKLYNKIVVKRVRTIRGKKKMHVNPNS